MNEPLTDFIEIGPECFSDSEENVISYKGENYYRACGAFVGFLKDGGSEYCVKRAGHPGDEHEAYSGKKANWIKKDG